MVYYITTMSNGDYVGGDIPRDVTEFQALFNQYTQGAAAIQPTYQPLTLGNIQALREKEAEEPPTEEIPSEEPPAVEDPEQPQSYRCGDVNDDNEIDIMDVILVNKYLLGTAELSAQGKASADADANGIIDTTDSLLIIKYVVELIETLPIGKNS